MHLNNLLITRTTWFPCYEYDLPHGGRGLIKFRQEHNDTKYYYVDTYGVSIIPIEHSPIFNIFLNLKKHLNFTIILGSKIEVYIVMNEIKKILPFQDVVAGKKGEDKILSIKGYSLRLINRECNKNVDEYLEKSADKWYEYPPSYFNYMVK